jgi:hypothetical protein
LINMNIGSHKTKALLRRAALSTLGTVVLILPMLGSADDAGFYSGRISTSGTPGAPPKDQAQLALEPGSAALTSDGTRLQGERVFGGYRFGPGFALEAAQNRTGASVLAPGTETISVAGVSSLPLSDSVNLLGKVGLNYAPSSFTAGSPSLSDVANGGKVYGVGLSAQVRNNVELRVQSEHLGRPSALQGPPASDSVLVGANVRF